MDKTVILRAIKSRLEKLYNRGGDGIYFYGDHKTENLYLSDTVRIDFQLVMGMYSISLDCKIFLDGEQLLKYSSHVGEYHLAEDGEDEEEWVVEALRESMSDVFIIGLILDPLKYIIQNLENVKNSKKRLGGTS